MKKNLLVSMLIGLMLCASPVFAGFLGSGVIDNAQKLFDKTDYEMTINVINGGLRDGKIDDSEMGKAYKLLGQAYEKIDHNSDAKKAYRQAVVAEGTSYCAGQTILNLDIRNLEEIFPKLMEMAKSDNQLKANYGADIGQLAQKELNAGDIDDAEKLYKFSLRIDPNPARQKEAFDRFFEIGKQKKGNEAANYADKAVKYASTQEEKEKVGKLYLKVATGVWPSKDYQAFKNRAISLIGIEFVNKVFVVKPTTVFTKNFTDKDADKKGHIAVFIWKNETKKGDILRIKAKIKGNENNLDEVGLHLGNSQWYIENGAIEKVVDSTLPYQSYTNCVIAINLNKQIVLSVDVIREIETPNNNQP